MDGTMAMVRNSSFFAQVFGALSLVGAGLLSLAGTASAHAQATPRITSQVENSALVSLPGEVHPWARTQFDRGPAPANLSGRMLLVLKRSPEQEAALQTLLAAQQDPHSPKYHKWLTPEDFGKQFGVADSDVQTVTGYLSAQGMSVGRIYGSHMAIEVGATAAQIKSTFQTEIHAYSVSGKTFYANNSNPKIPSALSSVVSGFAALNNFRAEGGSGAGTQGTFDAATHTVKPLFTVTPTTPVTPTNPVTFGVSPGDLAVIYDIPASTGAGLGGTNVNVGIVGDSDINVAYVNNYRAIFGLSVNPPTVVVDGNDPGVTGDAYIAYKQIELVGAVAPKANIYYYTSATTDYDTGLDFALVRAIADNKVQVLLIGFQTCETAIDSGAIALINEGTEEAAAQGMTVVAASGNTGSAGCEVPGTAGKATTGLAVNGYASSPFVTAVGGTDFFYGTNPVTTYWGANTGFTSAKMYIPEQVWNDSFSANGNGNAVTGAPSVELASGGGPSTAGLDGINTPEPIPSYQAGNINGISSTSRVIPDVSFFAGSGANNTQGYNNTAYLFCMQASDCQTTGTPQFTYSGGTEASSAVFAGAVALAVNKINSGSAFGLGNINPALYAQLVSQGFISHDITQGTNELACTNGTPNCSNGHMSNYAAGPGYDAATGWGSLDITSFVDNYAPTGTAASSVSLTIIDPTTGKAPVCGTIPNCTTHSTVLQFTVTATSASGTGVTPTGDVGIFTNSPLQADAAMEVMTLSSGTASNPFNLLPGGTYNLFARYAGDNTYASSVGAANPSTITVQPEACQMKVYGQNVFIGSTTNIPYGTPVHITVEPYSAASTNNFGIPSGSITVTDSGKQITALPVNSEGAATFNSNLLPLGPHSITLTFPGDASFTSCSSGPYGATVVTAPTTTTLNPPNANANSGTIFMTATVSPTPVAVSPATTPPTTYPSNGLAPSGTVTFTSGTKTIQANVPLVSGFDTNGNAIATASISVSSQILPSGSLTATYNPGNANYAKSSATANVSFSDPFFNGTSATSFTISDTEGITNQVGPYPATDSLTLSIHVASNADPSGQSAPCVIFGIRLCSQPTVSVFADGIQLTNTLTVDANGNATFTLPRQNGNLELPSGQVQISVIYSGYFFLNGNIAENGASSAVQTITIGDDRTSADFSLQSDTTVNQAAPLISPTATATYNLRLTSLFNFNSPPFSTTPIALSCKVSGYSLGGVRSTVPAGLTCGLGSQSVTLGTSGFASSTLVVSAAPGFSIAGNTAPAQPATRWWMATGGTTLACIFLLGVPARRRKWQSLLGVCVLAIVGFGMTGCGAAVAPGPNQSYYDQLNGGNGGSQAAATTAVPAGTYTVLVTATAITNTTTNTTLVHTLPVEVLVGKTN
jgi:trimeric autotransporter adhesin